MAKHDSIYTVQIHLEGPTADSARSELTYAAVALGNAAPGGPADIQLSEGIALRVDLAWQIFWPLYSPSSWKYRGVTVTAWNSSGDAVDGAHRDQNVPGGAPVTALPPGNCIMVTKVVNNVPGVRRQPTGRWFVPSVNEAQVDDAGNITQAQFVAVSTVLNNLRLDHESTTMLGQPTAIQLEYKASKAAVKLSRAHVSSLQVEQHTTYLRRRGRK
jgi:hypothetical protein